MTKKRATPTQSTNDSNRQAPTDPRPHEDRSTIDVDADADADAHAHALARVHAGDQTQLPDYDNRSGLFPHEKLDVYRVALEMAALAKELADEIPRGHRNVADHLIRAAEDTVLLCAEGTNRRGAALKRQRFVESRGEVGEVAAAADLIIVLRLGNAARALKMKRLANRVSAMLTPHDRSSRIAIFPFAVSAALRERMRRRRNRFACACARAVGVIVWRARARTASA